MAATTMPRGKVTPAQELAWLTQERDQAEIMWAAGFFDGEGCVTIHQRAKKTAHHSGERAALGVTIGQSYVTEELDRFRRAVGFPHIRISGPYRSPKSSAPRYVVVFTGRRAHMVMGLLLPHLCSRKREKYLYLVASKGV